MAHFAKLDENNIVLEVNVVNNEDIQNFPFPDSEAVGIEFLNNWAGQEFVWKQTSYNGNFRKNYAGIGFAYDQGRDAFIPIKPFESWVLDELTCQWKAPVDYPSDGQDYYWDETSVSWILSEQQHSTIVGTQEF